MNLFKRHKKITKNNLFVNCNDLTMDRLLDYYFDGNLKRLQKDESIVVEETILIEKWDVIFYEFCDLCKAENQKLIHKNKKDSLIVRNKMYILETSIYLMIKTFKLDLNEMYAPKCIEALKSLGYIYDFNYKNTESYLSDLENCSKRKEALQMQLNSLEIKYKELTKDSGENKITRSYYEEQLAIINKWLGGKYIHMNEITVSEFCANINLIKEEAKNAKEKGGNSGRR